MNIGKVRWPRSTIFCLGSHLFCLGRVCIEILSMLFQSLIVIKTANCFSEVVNLSYFIILLAAVVLRVSVYGPCLRDRNQWSFDMFFAQESFKNALFLMILVCMDRAQSEELGTLYFCRCQMYIS